ncbi:hypothetical protein B0H11DRAFT_2257413 [Mycena galericulata]|nr:hypothetical protein B0H11DRAFT_2257413 [Mycena galericulata]
MARGRVGLVSLLGAPPSAPLSSPSSFSSRSSDLPSFIPAPPSISTSTPLAPPLLSLPLLLVVELSRPPPVPLAILPVSTRTPSPYRPRPSIPHGRFASFTPALYFPFYMLSLLSSNTSRIPLTLLFSSPPIPNTLALSAHTARAFARLVSGRALPEEMIVRVGVLAQGAVWVGRMIASPSSSSPSTAAAGDERDGDKKDIGGKEKEKGRRRRHPSGPAAPAPAPSTNVPAAVQSAEERARLQAAQLAHLLALHTALLGVGVRELAEVDLYTAVGVAASSATVAAVGAAVANPHGHGGGGRGRRGRGGMLANGNASGGAVGIPTNGHGNVGGSIGVTASGLGGQGQELAERISAAFRRTLPALRVGSKWVLGNWGWVCEAASAGATSSNSDCGEAKGDEGKGEREKGESAEERELRAQAARFWATYAEFLRGLSRAFPIALLPALSVPAREVEGEGDGEREGEVQLELELEEDVDMRGWLPLRGLMGGPIPPPPAETGPGAENAKEEKRERERERERRTVGQREEVHPNVEQLMRIADLLRDARRIVALEGSPLALYGGQFVVKGVEAAKPVAPAAPLRTPALAPVLRNAIAGFAPADPLASIRDSRLALQMDLEDDAMTEKTSRTDEDLLHDAFSFLNHNDDAAEDASDEDEIVWDLREAPVSPIVPTARTSPKTPVRPPPIAPPLRGPLASPLSPFRSPQPITPGTQIPATTALDLLNNFSVPKPPKPPGEGLLFGARAGPGPNLSVGVAPAQSIWSASRDEQGLMFATGAAPHSHHQQQYQQQQQQQQPQPQHQQQHAPHYQGLPQSAGLGFAQYPGEQTHQRFASQDTSSQSTIWSSSYPTASQHNIPAGFVQQPLTAQHQHHHRVVSNSMAAAQLFPSGGDQYGYGPLSGPAPHYAGGMDGGGMAMDSGGGRGMGQDQLGVFYATSPAASGHQGFSAQGPGLMQHGRHASLGMHDPRGGVFPGQPITPMSQLWGNVG